MKTKIRFLLLLSVLIFSSCGDKKMDKEEKEIQTEIKQLSDKDFKTREAAVKKLVNRGSDLLTDLGDYYNSKDLQQKVNIRRVMVAILTPIYDLNDSENWMNQVGFHKNDYPEVFLEILYHKIASNTRKDLILFQESIESINNRKSTEMMLSALLFQNTNNNGRAVLYDLIRSRAINLKSKLQNNPNNNNIEIESELNEIISQLRKFANDLSKAEHDRKLVIDMLQEIE